MIACFRIKLLKQCSSVKGTVYIHKMAKLWSQKVLICMPTCVETSSVLLFNVAKFGLQYCKALFP